MVPYSGADNTQSSPNRVRVIYAGWRSTIVTRYEDAIYTAIITEADTTGIAYTHSDNYGLLSALTDDFRPDAPKNTLFHWQRLYSPFSKTRKGFRVKDRQGAVRLQIWGGDRGHWRRDVSIPRPYAYKVDRVSCGRMAGKRKKVPCVRGEAVPDQGS